MTAQAVALRVYRPRVRILSLRRILRAVVRTLPCGAGSLSVGRPQGVGLSRWILVAGSRYQAGVAPPPYAWRHSMLKTAWEVNSPVFGHTGKALVHAARRRICSSRLKAGRSIPPRSRPFDITRPQVFGARAMSCHWIRRRFCRCDQQERSRMPQILANMCTNSEWTKSLPAIGHHSSALSHNDDNRKPV
jgi:hypothetical protein